MSVYRYVYRGMVCSMNYTIDGVRKRELWFMIRFRWAMRGEALGYRDVLGYMRLTGHSVKIKGRFYRIF